MINTMIFINKYLLKTCTGSGYTFFFKATSCITIIISSPGRSLQKTDCCNVLSDFCKEVCSAIQRKFSATIGSEVVLWARSGIKKNQKINTPVPWPRPDLRECVTSMIFQGIFFFFLLGGLGREVPNWKSQSDFFCFQNILKYHGDL